MRRASGATRAENTGLLTVLAAACRRIAVPLLGAAVIVAACQSGDASGGPPPVDTTTPPDTTIKPPPAPPQVVLASGDISSCTQDWDEATAKIIDTIPGTVAVLGDQVYDVGSPDEYANCYGPTWGRFRSRTRPAPGNHDYATVNAAGYYGYFGLAAGDPAKGYYSYDLGKFWHVVVLNSAWREGGPAFGQGSAQLDWLRADLAASSRQCTLAYWHHPRWSSGNHAPDTSAAPVWRVLYAAGADLVLNGHEHFYERFAPMNPDGAADNAYGIRQITTGMAGTGASSGYPFGTPLAASEMRQNIAAGIIKLTLDSAGYSWQYLHVVGASFSDAGSGSCHSAPNHAAPPQAQAVRPTAHEIARATLSDLQDPRP